MPIFKPKTNKKVKYNKKNSITLDNKHKEFLNEFSKDENNRLPELKNEKNGLKKELENTDLSIEQKLDIQDRIKEINTSIKEIKAKKKEYFLDNSKHIFEYFENKKNIAINQNVLNKNTLLNNFFKINQDNDTDKNSQNVNKNIVQKYLSNIDDIFFDINY